MSNKQSYRHPLTKLKGLFPRRLSSSQIFFSDQNRPKIDPFLYAEAIIEALHSPIIILDKQFIVRAANKSFFKTFKVGKKTTIGSTADDYRAYSPEQGELIHRLKKVRDTNTSFQEFEITYQFPKVGERTVLINAQRIVFDKATTDFILMEVQDITKRKRMEQQKDDFVGFVTHELKTPITSILAFVQILQGYHTKTGDKRSQFLLQKIDAQMKRLTALLQSFADVYKAQTNNIELRKKQFDLPQLIHEVVETFQYSTSTHSISIEGTIKHSVLGDRERIHEVLTNLLTNAIKYSPNADKIIIKIEETAKEVIVHIRDFGIGITAAEQEKVFERFFRVRGKTENHIEGLGLGLYIVATIIKQHGGKIAVKSTEGKGSTFTFTLPLKK